MPCPRAEWRTCGMSTCGRDPIGTMAQAYRDLGMELSEPARAAMQAMLDAESRKPRDVHIHSPEGFGLSAEAVRERLAATADASSYEASGLLLSLAFAALNKRRTLTPAQMNRISKTTSTTMLTQGTYT